MAGWRAHEGLAVALPLDNVDTDQIIPARFMSTPRAEGYESFLFHDLRRGADGMLDPAFPLTRWPEASVLIAGRNFGCGSSREAAVYALVDAGIRAVIAPGFGDIFAGNAANNGLLAAPVSASEAAALANATPAPARIDLTEGRVSVGDVEARFDLPDTVREKLINGWDDIDLTRDRANAISKFRQARMRAAPWAFAGPRSEG